MDCLKCRKTGVCDTLPKELSERLAFAGQPHDCCQPHALARPVRCSWCGGSFGKDGPIDLGAEDWLCSECAMQYERDMAEQEARFEQHWERSLMYQLPED